MEILNFVQTLTTSAVALSVPGRAVQPLCRRVDLQPGAANSNPMYLGGAGVTTSTGIRLEGKDSDNRPSAPYPFVNSVDHPMPLDLVYVLGTAGETVRVQVVTS